MSYRIMVPLDGSAFAEAALPTAYSLAQRLGAGVHLVRVHHPPLAAAGPGGGAAVDSAFDQELEDEGRRYLDVLLRRIEAHERARSATAHLRGPVVQTLTDYIHDESVDLVVMTTHARGGLSRLWLGSVADGLVRLTTVPVLLLRPGRQRPSPPAAAPPFRRVLLPVDGGSAGDRVLEHAIALAGTSGVEYTLLRVLTTRGRSADTGRAALQTILDLKAQRLRARGLTVRSQVVVSDTAAEGILRYAAEHDVGLVAMATRSRGGLERLLLGSVADRVLRQAGIPLLLWNPGQPAAFAPAEVLAPLARMPVPAQP
jgi:nucleotide-binding universal stress UspA family protein